MEKILDKYKRLIWSTGIVMIVLGFFIMAFLVFAYSPKDWGSLSLPLITIPVFGIAMLIISGDSINPTLSFDINTTSSQYKMVYTAENNKPLFKVNDILCMAIVYERYLPKGCEINDFELATEIMTSRHAIGSLNSTRLSKNTMICVQKAKSNFSYQGDYAPKDDLPMLIQNLQKELIYKMRTNGDQVDQISIKNLMFKSHSNIAGVIWVQINILQ